MSSPETPLPPFDPESNAARQALWRFASLALSDPRTGAHALLSDPTDRDVALGAAEWLRSDPMARPSELALAELPLERIDPSRVIERLPGDPDDREATWQATFGLIASGSCPVHETDWVRGRDGFRRAAHLADVSGFYRAFGLRSARAVPERPDHLALELEFVAFLLGRERDAASQEPHPAARERRAVVVAAERRFLAEHVAWWAPACARLLAREARGTWFEGVAELVAALVPAERARLGVPAPERGAPPVPEPIERPESCEGCPVAL